METFSNVWTKLGGRKLISFFLGLTALLVLALTDNLTETAMYGILGLAAAFNGGNIGEHIANALTKRAAEPAAVEERVEGGDDG